jgi:hypothetical protein
MGFRALVAQGKAVQMFRVGGETFFPFACIKLTARSSDPYYLGSGQYRASGQAAELPIRCGDDQLHARRSQSL